jgi:hypothetical protein
MNYDRAERRTYRRSPGRQYGYEYDPLSSDTPTGNGRTSSSPQSEPLTGMLKDSGPLDSRRTSGPLSPRPDPRRTRQLLRQQILATKKASLEGDTGQIDPDIHTEYVEPDSDELLYEEDIPPARPATRRSGSVRYTSRPLQSRRATRDFADYREPVAPPQPLPYERELEYLDPDMGYDEGYDDDPLADRVGYRESQRLPAPIIEREPALPPETGRRRGTALAEPEWDEEEEDLRPRKKKKKGLLSRRKLIAGAILVGGGAVAAYELGPKIPGALESAGTNIEHQIQDAFNRGFAAGGEAVRKELINGLDTLEGVSLEGAIGAAKLTRVAYDVFVSPIVTLASTIADDFLTALLKALITARGWLKQINADNATLVALTSILQNWVDQVHNMPKKLQTITDTDLDGATAYLSALQRKIQQQQAILNGQVTPTPGTTPQIQQTTQPGTTPTPGHP